jgi:hypothetical protein
MIPAKNFRVLLSRKNPAIGIVLKTVISMPLSERYRHHPEAVRLVKNAAVSECGHTPIS